MRSLVLALFVVGCGSSEPKPAAPPPPPTTSPSACSNACVERDAKCNDACLAEDAPPPGDDDEGCASRCRKTLEACMTHCK